MIFYNLVRGQDPTKRTMHITFSFLSSREEGREEGLNRLQMLARKSTTNVCAQNLGSEFLQLQQAKKSCFGSLTLPP